MWPRYGGRPREVGQGDRVHLGDSRPHYDFGRDGYLGEFLDESLDDSLDFGISFVLVDVESSPTECLKRGNKSTRTMSTYWPPTDDKGTASSRRRRTTCNLISQQHLLGDNRSTVPAPSTGQDAQRLDRSTLALTKDRSCDDALAWTITKMHIVPTVLTNSYQQTHSLLKTLTRKSQSRPESEILSGAYLFGLAEGDSSSTGGPRGRSRTYSSGETESNSAQRGGRGGAYLRGV